MKSVELTAIGTAEKVVRCIDVPDPGAPGKGEILEDINASNNIVCGTEGGEFDCFHIILSD